jgi:hypothetical protein
MWVVHGSVLGAMGCIENRRVSASSGDKMERFDLVKITVSSLDEESLVLVKWRGTGKSPWQGSFWGEWVCELVRVIHDTYGSSLIGFHTVSLQSGRERFFCHDSDAIVDFLKRIGRY